MQDEVLDFVELTREKPVDVRFIEYMPFDGNQWNDQKLVPYREMTEAIGEKYDLERLDDHPNDTAKGMFRVDVFILIFSYLFNLALLGPRGGHSHGARMASEGAQGPRQLYYLNDRKFLQLMQSDPTDGGR